MSARGVDGQLAQARRWVEADGAHIDVRGLQPPGPLVAILDQVESIGSCRMGTGPTTPTPRGIRTESTPRLFG